MSKIICTLENASNLINGIKFQPAEGVEGLLSEDVSESVAALFLSIPGYVLHGADGEEGSDTKTTTQTETPASAEPVAPAETPAQRKARLKAEKEAAEKAAAENATAEAGEGDNNEVF